MLKDVRAILMAPGGIFWIASEKAKAAVPYDTSGKPGLHPQRGGAARALPHAAGGDRGRGEDGGTHRPPRRQDLHHTLRQAGGARAPGAHPVRGGDARGAILVADEKKKKVYRFDAKQEYLGTFPDKDTKEREITRMFLDGEGGIVLLDKEERTVRVVDETGKVLRTVGPAGLKKPVDVAVDSFRNTYVADEEGSVLHLQREGPAPRDTRRPGDEAAARPDARRGRRRPRLRRPRREGAALQVVGFPRRFRMMSKRRSVLVLVFVLAGVRASPAPRPPWTRRSARCRRPRTSSRGRSRSSREPSRADPSSSSTRSSAGSTW